MGLNFGGLARGLGASLAYIGQQGIAEQQRVAADQRLLDREQAFARTQQTIRNEDLNTAVGRSVDEMKAQAPHIVALEEDKLNVREPFQERQHQRETTARTEQQEREQSFRLQLEGLQHQYRLSENQVSQALADSLADENISHWAVTRDGQLVGYDRNGQVRGRTDAGVYEPSGGPEDSEGNNPNLPSPSEVSRRQRNRQPAPAAPSRPTGTLSPRGSAPVRVTTAAEAARLPRGTRFITPDGRTGTRN